MISRNLDEQDNEMTLLQVPELLKTQYTSAMIPPGRHVLPVAKRKVQDLVCWDAGTERLETKFLLVLIGSEKLI